MCWWHCKILPKVTRLSYNGEEYELQEKIPAKHKFFTKDMNTGDDVIMYGVLVGKAQTTIPERRSDDD